MEEEEEQIPTTLETMADQAVAVRLLGSELKLGDLEILHQRLHHKETMAGQMVHLLLHSHPVVEAVLVRSAAAAVGQRLAQAGRVLHPQLRERQ
jgi:hypothetical protein